MLNKNCMYFTVLGGKKTSVEGTDKQYWKSVYKFFYVFTVQ